MIAIASIVLLLACVVPLRLQSEDVTSTTEMEQQILDWTNQERAKVNAPALKWNNRLALAARLHSDEMASHKFEDDWIGKKRSLSPSDASRLLTRMTDDGWLLRTKAIWAKRNPVPSSVRSRFSPGWEYVYFFAKAPGYFFDIDAVKVPGRRHLLLFDPDQFRLPVPMIMAPERAPLSPRGTRGEENEGP